MAKKVKVSFKKDPIICYPLTFGYLLDIENEVIEESKLGIIKDATNLKEDEIRKLKVPETTLIIETIKKETYPELYNEDGSFKLVDEDEDKGKKKV